MSDAPFLQFAAVILIGGTGTRMGGADKAALELAGSTLLERALSATAAATEVVVVGRPVPTSRPVSWTVEEPPGGGPAAGLLAGLDRLGAAPALVAALAVDMPQVTTSTFHRLGAALQADPEAAGAVLVDDRGRSQPLCAVYRVASLQSARPIDPTRAHGMPVFALIGSLRLLRLRAQGSEASDVDTWDDLAALDE